MALKRGLALVAIAAAGVATGLWGVGGAGAKLTGTETTSTTTQTTPLITSFGPTSGPQGTRIWIHGDGFTAATAVRINGAPVPFTVESNYAIIATVPAGATSGPLSVETPLGTTSADHRSR